MLLFEDSGSYCLSIAGEVTYLGDKSLVSIKLRDATLGHKVNSDQSCRRDAMKEPHNPGEIIP